METKRQVLTPEEFMKALNLPQDMCFLIEREKRRCGRTWLNT
jgi:hypothetical protein